MLLALGLDAALAQGSVVFTLEQDNEPDEVEYVTGVMSRVVQRLREMSPVYRSKQQKNKSREPH